MMILRPYETRLLLPMPRREWMAPSQAERKTVFGHAPVERRWHVSARLHDGHVRWRGTFRDREDADAFLWAAISGTLDHEPALWRLPVPAYCPDYGEAATFLFAATITITSGTSQSRPSDWNNSANTIEAIGGGGSGSCGAKKNGNRGSGGSGAEYRKLTNYSAGGTFNYTIGAGGTAVSRSTAGVTAGNDGGDTILDTTALIAKKGLGGTILNGSNPTAPAGGTGGTGGSGFDGGAGGSIGHNDSNTGGGGAGGPGGAGGAGAATTNNNQATNGGQGGNGSGGSAGTGQVLGTASTATGTAGGNGTDMTSLGSGGGGGAANNTSSGASQGGNGGSYGGGGGGANTKNAGGNSTSGAGIQGVILMTYTPAVAVFAGNLPMLGM